MTSPDGEGDRLHDLVRVLLDEEIGEAKLCELSELLRDDPAAMRRYLAYMSLDAELAWECGRAELSPVEKRATGAREGSVRRRRSWLARGAVGAAAAAVAVVAIFILLPGQQQLPIAADSMLILKHLSGEVRVSGGDGQPVNLALGTRISAGATATTLGPTSFATFAYDDGTRILVAGDSQATFSGQNQKSIETLRGTISAAVAPQPAGQPLLVTTQQARLEVLGTEFLLAASADETDLQAKEGSVKLTRVADGESVVVAQGKRVEADVFLSDLVVRDAQPPPSTWGEDFEAGLPHTWMAGKFISAGLPDRSRGGVQAQLDKETQIYGVTSPHPWSKGLFVIHADTHLHMTYQMERPDWVNLFFITRTDDAGLPTTFLHKFSGLPAARADAGRWRTATIPLSDFQRKSERGFEDVPPRVGELVFGISCSAPKPNRGLVIDRIWVTQGGSGKVVVEDVE